MTLPKVLELITRIFDDLDIPYMLSGSLALSIYAIPRDTRDIDLVVEFPKTQINHFIGRISNLFYFNEKTINDEVRRKGMFNLIHLDSGYKIDIIVCTSQPYELLKFGRRKQYEVLGISVWVISLEDLIISKLAWIQQLESELQKRDIISLMENDSKDSEYIANWCKQLNLKTYNLISYE